MSIFYKYELLNIITSLPLKTRLNKMKINKDLLRVRTKWGGS